MYLVYLSADNVESDTYMYTYSYTDKSIFLGGDQVKKYIRSS